MSRKSRKEKKKWRFYWKNVNGLGRLLRIAAGAAFLYAASQMKDDQTTAGALGLFGIYLIVVGGLLRWCSLRALLHKPTKRAYLKHYPEGA
ncbi:MAG: DUF2892 domain-containing protein [Actinobacteria bacterium]|nr:DUF2892 domain-containing protein [Actinomycetota bacterium]MBU1944282.1 DUF2892 domain-containing protein [Actinomycetota bacterium]MBU2688258.1 DUF2892 domain-containing protein [Actinomycetota bacterium]